MCVCLCACACVCSRHVCMHVCVFMCARVCMHACERECVFKWVGLRVCVFVYVCRYAAFIYALYIHTWAHIIYYVQTGTHVAQTHAHNLTVI